VGTTIGVLAIGRNNYFSNLDLCLTARALGAAEITIVGKAQPRLARHIGNLNKKWGGRFKVKFAKNYKQALKDSSKYVKIYLTKYGIPLQEKRYQLKTYKNILLIITSDEYAKTDPIHNLAHFNISVSSQPHCSSAAVAIFLHEFYNGRELAMHFENAQYKVMPEERGVHVKKIE